eukprot:scaffold34372_cov60-Phaeocystis_antarctica.AAC.1
MLSYTRALLIYSRHVRYQPGVVAGRPRPAARRLRPHGIPAPCSRRPAPRRASPDAAGRPPPAYRRASPPLCAHPPPQAPRLAPWPNRPQAEQGERASQSPPPPPPAFVLRAAIPESGPPPASLAFDPPLRATCPPRPGTSRRRQNHPHRPPGRRPPRPRATCPPAGPPRGPPAGPPLGLLAGPAGPLTPPGPLAPAGLPRAMCPPRPDHMTLGRQRRRAHPPRMAVL